MTSFDAQREVVMSWIVACAAICALAGGTTLWQMGRSEPRPLTNDAWAVAAPLAGAQRNSGEGSLPLVYDRGDSEAIGVEAVPTDAAPGT